MQLSSKDREDLVGSKTIIFYRKTDIFLLFLFRNFIFSVGAGKKNTTATVPLAVPTKQKMSRDDNSHNSLPKQLSSDSLPVTAAKSVPTK